MTTNLCDTSDRCVLDGRCPFYGRCMTIDEDEWDDYDEVSRW